MVTDRKLLWRAWPDGYLAMRGVATVGGYQCVGVAHTSIWTILRESREIDHPDVQIDIGRGLLLPNVDSTDTATWACLLKELDPRAVALRRIPPPYGPTWELWTQHADGQHYAKRLFLNDRLRQTFDIDDPAETLVRARIQRREAK